MCRGAHSYIPRVFFRTCMYLILYMRTCGSCGMPCRVEPHRFCKMNGVGPLLLLLFFFTLPRGGTPYVRSAHEGHYPYVWDSVSLRPVVWARGSMLQHVIGASAVRVTDNRIRFIPAAWTLLPAGGSTTCSSPCMPDAFALCTVSGHELRDTLGIGEGSLVFPIDGKEVRVHGNTTNMCKKGQGRTSEASDMFKSVYDISVCDVVEGLLDILFVHDRVCCPPHVSFTVLNLPMFSCDFLSYFLIHPIL
jgi:hypothetical protein